ncbi:MAG: glycosyltransferase [Planctomycetes bacterium]|nr:glycosyltransferase [Planctomycetota bacterium]
MALRIAMLHQHAGGGATVAVHELMAGLRALGHEVQDLTPARDAPLVALLGRIEAFTPDIVHAHCFYNAMDYASILEVAQRWPLVFTLHDTLPVNQFGPECWECFRNAYCLGCPALGPLRRWRPNYRVVARMARRRVHRKLQAHLILPSEWMRLRIARSELAALPSTYIPYGIDIAGFAQSAHVPRIETQVFFAGNMYSAEDHRKGLPDLLAAWIQVRAVMPTAHLAVAGRVAAGLLPTGVEACGELSRSAVQQRLASATVVCVPSRGDNLPLAVMEAMASRCCVVATRVGGIPEMIIDGVSGLLVPPASPNALAQTLLSALQQPGLAARLGAAAAEHASRTWPRELCAQRHEALYRSITVTA